MATNNELKQTLIKHLEGGEAFMPVDEMLQKITYERLGERPKNLPYSFYELFYHMWFTQKDILNYCIREDYKAHSWPDGYWPQEQSPKSKEDWKGLKNAFFDDRQALTNLLSTSELSEPVPSNPNHSFFREALLVIEHSAYHSGQLLIILRELGLHS
ncbi:MAG: DinB family protein [Salinimicrobium sp.]